MKKYNDFYVEDKIYIANHIIKATEIKNLIESIKSFKIFINKLSKDKQKDYNIKLNKYLNNLNLRIKDFLKNFKLGICFMAEYNDFILENCSEEVINYYNKKFEEIKESSCVKFKSKTSQLEEMMAFSRVEIKNTTEFFEEYDGNDKAVIKVKDELDNLHLLNFYRYKED